MKFIEGLFIFALVACFAGNCACISSGTSVTSLTSVRYQAAVLCPVIMCSGAVVSPRNVVTTATCINFLLPADVQVYVGSNTYYTNGFTFNVANIVTHPNFNPSSYDSNIAVLTLETPIPSSLTTVQPIPLAVVAPPTDSFVTVTAYGAVNPNLDLANVLQKVNLQAFSKARCQTIKNNKLTASMFCAGDVNGKKDLCPGDQGAPVVYENKLVGIYSWGCSCGLAYPNPSSPVFNSIPFFRNWIQSKSITQ